MVGTSGSNSATSFSDSVSLATLQCWNVDGVLRVRADCLEFLRADLAAGEVGVLPGCFLGLLLAVIGEVTS